MIKTNITYMLGEKTRVVINYFENSYTYRLNEYMVNRPTPTLIYNTFLNGIHTLMGKIVMDLSHL